MAKFTPADVNKSVVRINQGDEEQVLDIIVAVPGMKEYDDLHPMQTPDGIENPHNAHGVMLRSHPWEHEENWELNES